MPFLEGLFSSIGRMLPGYIEGERQAIQDNWNDLNQYNQTQAGQLENMFTENTMDERLSMMDDAADNSYMGMLNNAMMLDVNRAYQPGRIIFGGQFSRWSPYLSEFMYQTQAQQGDFARQFWADPIRNAGIFGLGGTNAYMLPSLLSMVSGLGSNVNVPGIYQ